MRKRLQFAVVFGALGVVIGGTALPTGRLAIVLPGAWFAANALALAIAFVINWPGVFGKTRDGTFRLGSTLFFLPIHLLVGLVWSLQNRLWPTPQSSEILPDVYVGRICDFKALPPGVSLVVDLTAEFQTPRSIRRNVPFLCLPTLDGCPPNWDDLRKGFDAIEAGQQRVYVCCANGHGRSVTFVAALLGQRGICQSAAEAVQSIQAARPCAAPNRDQLRFLEQGFQSLKSTGAGAVRDA